MLAGQPDGMSAPQAATTQIRQGQEAGTGSRSWEQEHGTGAEAGSSFWARLMVAGNIGIMVIRLDSPRCPLLCRSVLIILQSL